MDMRLRQCAGWHYFHRHERRRQRLRRGECQEATIPRERYVEIMGNKTDETKQSDTASGGGQNGSTITKAVDLTERQKIICKMIAYSKCLILGNPILRHFWV